LNEPSLPVSADFSATPESRLGAFPKARLLAALGLFALTLWTFLPAIENGFVGYDDPELVTENSHVQSGINRENVKWAFCAPAAANWHPLTLLSHMLDCQWFGLAPWGHHLMSVLGHALSAVLLFLALDRMTRATGRSLAVALLFALHPLRIESVAWVAERKDVLSTLFGMLALYAYAAYAARAGRNDPNAKWFYGLTLVAFVAALLSKPMLVTLPFALLLLDYWPLRRMWNAETGVTRDATRITHPVPRFTFHASRTLLPLLVEKLPFLVITLVLSVVAYVVHSRAGDILTNLTLASRMENALVSYSRYLGKLFFPAGLSPFYPLVQPLPLGAVWGAGLLVAMVTALALVVWRTRPFFIVGWLWYLGTLVPVIGLVQVGTESMADRYTYIPCIGLLLALVWGLHEVLRPLRRRVAVETALAALAGLCCIVITRQQIARWRDTETLFRHALAVTTGNYIAHNNLGTALDKQERFAEAAAEFRKAIQENPDYAQAHNNLGIVLGEQGQLDQATTQYLKAIELKPTYPNPYNNLGLALSQQGRLDEAMRHFAQAIALQPDYADAHYNLAQALARAGRLNEAIVEYRQTLKLQPGSADAHNNLGVALDQQGRLQDAAGEFLEAIRLKPDYARAYFNLGVTLGKGGQINEAIAAFEQALKLKPDYPAAQTNLAQLLEFKRSSPK
jgi:protein O-mannosyl-transferase